MKTINRATAIALPALLLSQGVASAAATSSDAVEACTSAIAAYIEGKQGLVPTTQIDESRFNGRRRLSRLTVFEMDAYDSSKENVVGRFTCTVNNHAEVKKLVTLPLSAPDAVFRGQS